MFCPGSTIYHIGGGTLPKNNARKTYLNIRNNIIMLYKNLQGKRMVKVFAARIFLDWVAALKFLVDGGFKDMWAVARAHLHILRNLHRLRKKRERIHHQRVSEIYWGNIVVEHFLKRKKKFSELDQHKFTKGPPGG